MSFFPNPIIASNTTTPRTLVTRFGEVLNVQDFGAVGDGVTEDSAAIQAAINKAISLSSSAIGDYYRGATVFFPRGVYLISSNITWEGANASGITLQGEGQGITIIKCNRASGDIFTIGNTSSRIDNTRIMEMTFYSVPKMSTGAIIRVINGHSVTLQNLRFPENPDYPTPILAGGGFVSDFTRIYTCIEINSGTGSNAETFQVYIDRVDINNGVYGIVLGGSGGIVQDIFISNTIIAQCTDTGLLITHAGGVNLLKSGTLYCNKGIATYPGSGQVVYWLFMNDWGSDTSVDDGGAFISNGGKVQGVQMTGCWFSNNGQWQNGLSSAATNPNGGRGLWISAGSNITGFNIGELRAFTNRRQGILIENARKIYISNAFVGYNGLQGSNTIDGVLISSSTDIGINGGMFGDGLLTVGTNSQRYGIRIEGSSDRIQVLGANTVGNQTGGISDVSSGGTKAIANNL